MSSQRRVVFKIVLIGDNAVGKTSIRRRYLGKGFEKAYAMTLGVDIGIKRMDYEGIPYTFQIWDLGGHASFEIIRKMYYKNIKSLMVVFDLTNIQTLINVKKWIEEYRKYGYDDQICSVLIGNKEDLVSEVPNSMMQNISEVTNFMKEELRDEVKFIQTSALSGKNVNEAFEWIIQKSLSSIS